MKDAIKTITATILTVAFTFSTTNLIAGGSHDHKHSDEVEEYDPIENEFGMYKANMDITQTIEISMSDQMRFTPNIIKVKKGDVILFEHTNNGQLMHEFVLGTPDTLDEHAELMKKFPGMEHSEPYMLHVAPGKSGKMVWRFSETGEFAFGCLIPGHYDAGMKGTVIVES